MRAGWCSRGLGRYPGSQPEGRGCESHPRYSERPAEEAFRFPPPTAAGLGRQIPRILDSPSLRDARDAAEAFKARLESYRIRALVGLTWKADIRAMKSLQTLTQHWTIPLLEQPLSDMHHALRIDSEEVAVVREVVDRTQSQAVDDGGDPFGLGILDDVCRLDE